MGCWGPRPHSVLGSGCHPAMVFGSQNEEFDSLKIQRDAQHSGNAQKLRKTGKAGREEKGWHYHRREGACIPHPCSPNSATTRTARENYAHFILVCYTSNLAKNKGTTFRVALLWEGAAAKPCSIPNPVSATGKRLHPFRWFSQRQQALPIFFQDVLCNCMDCFLKRTTEFRKSNSGTDCLFPWKCSRQE